MSWFGWLTKGRCEVSALDGLVLIGEFIAVFAILVLILGRKRK